jgi:hypothetical protein
MRMLRALTSFVAIGAVLAIAALAFAEGPRLVRRDADGGVEDAATEGPPPAGWLPDPPGLTTRHQWILDLRWSEGDMQLGGARRIELPRPTPTPRMMGRFMVELYIGRELLDRVRFDFPLLGADEFAGAKRPREAPPAFEPKLKTSAAIMIPHSERATRAVLVDRATGRTLELPWPPDAAADGGVAQPRDAGPGD